MKSLVRSSTIVIAVMLSACTKPDVAACEAYIKDGLKSPSTYRQISIRSYDTPFESQAQLEKELGLPKPENDVDEVSRDLWRLKAKGQKVSLRSMYIDYDADNAYGTPVRGLAGCQFRLLNGALPGADELDQIQNGVRARRVTRLVNELTEKPVKAWPTGSDCCVVAR